MAWIARDSNGTLCLFSKKPQKYTQYTNFGTVIEGWTPTLGGDVVTLPQKMCKELKYKDGPKKIKDIIFE